jgi:hypothetical protein
MNDAKKSTTEPWQIVLLDHLLNGYSIIQGFDDEESASGRERTRYWAELESSRENGRSSGAVSGPSGESYESHADALRELVKQLMRR